MLPSWAYVIIFILGILSSKNAHKKNLSIVFLIYFIMLLTLGLIQFESLAIYVFVRLVSHFILLVIIALTFKNPLDFLKIYAFFGGMTIIDCVFAFGVLFDDLSYMNTSLILSPYCLDCYCAVIGINNWENVKQALLGSSIGLFYVFHFIGLI